MRILLGLQRLDAGAARRFATDPSAWMEWVGGLRYPALAGVRRSTATC